MTWPRLAVAARGGPQPAAGRVAAGRPVASGQRLPRRACSRSIASNSALKLPLPKPSRAVPLDQLEEHRRPVLHRLGEHLQQVAVLVPVGEDLLGGQFGERHPGLAHPVAELLVVGVRGVEELDPRGLHGAHRGQDVVGGQRDVLYPGAAVELQVLVDLRLPLARRGLVDRELDLARAVRDHLAHQRRVLGGDVVADELLHVGEAHDAVVVADPLVHVAEFHVAHAVVDLGEEGLAGRCHQRVRRHVAGQVRARIVGPLHQRVAGVPVGGDRGQHHLAVLVLGRVRGGDGPGPAGDRVAEGLLRGQDADRQVGHAVAVRGHVRAELPCPPGPGRAARTAPGPTSARRRPRPGSRSPGHGRRRSACRRRWNSSGRPGGRCPPRRRRRPCR